MEAGGEDSAIVELLGPLRVGHASGEVRIDGAKRRLLLALLAADRHTPRSADWLATQLWGDDERPADAATTVRVHVSRLRRSSTAPIVATHPIGYQLDPSVELDVDEVASLTRRATTARDRGALDEALDAWAGALARWRGVALAEFDGSEELDRVARSLHQRRVDLVLAFADTVGRHRLAARTGQAIELLLAVARDEPMRAELVWRLAAAQVRSGARQAALDALDRLASALGGLDELSRDVREAIAADDPPATWVWERDVPAGAPGLDPVPTGPTVSEAAPNVEITPPPPPDRSTPLVGRDAALDRLRSLVAASGTRVALVCGPAGIGKSRLLHELAAVTAPGQVAYGRFEPDVRTPLRALRQALRWRDHAGDDAEPGEDGAAHTERVVAAAAERIAGVARAQGGLVLMVDDLHDADSLSLLTLVELVVQHPTAPVTLICTVRDAGRSMPLVRRLADRARRDDRFDEVTLDGLDVDDVEVMLAATAPDQVSHATAVRDVTGGNPYLVRLLATSLQHGHELPAAIEHTSDAIGDLVDHQIGSLDEHDLDMLRLAAAAGRTVRLEVLEQCTGSATASSLATIERLMHEQLLREDPGPVDRFTFAHELLRSYVLQATPSSTRRRLHGRIAAAFETLADDLHVTSAELADQWSKSHRTSRSARHFLDAARHAATRGAHAEALAAAESGLAFCEQDEALEAELQMAAAAALHDLGRLREGDERVHVAWVHARLAGRDDVLTQVAQLTGGKYVENRYDAGPGETLRSVLADVSDPRSRSLLLSRLVMVERNTDPRSSAWIEEALRLADVAGDVGARLTAQHAAVSLMYHRPDPRPRLDLALASLAEAERLGRRSTQIVLAIDACVAAVESDELDLAARMLHDTGDADDTPLDRWWLLSQRCMLATATGDLVAAEGLANEGRALGQSIGVADAAAWYFMQLWSINHRRGDDGALAKVFRRQLADVHASWRAAAAAELAAIGEREAATEVLDVLVDELPRLPHNYLTTGTLAIAAIAGRAAEHPALDVASELLAPLAHLHAVYGAGCADVGQIAPLLAPVPITTTEGTPP